VNQNPSLTGWTGGLTFVVGPFSFLKELNLCYTFYTDSSTPPEFFARIFGKRGQGGNSFSPHPVSSRPARAIGFLAAERAS
jgi:hypothetical protein